MKKTLIYAFLAAFLFLLSPTTSFAKDYSIPDAEIIVHLTKEGSALVSEKRTYDFDGSFTWADINIPLAAKCGGCVDYKVKNIAVFDGDTPIAPSNLTSSFNVQGINIRWNYLAVDQKKVFTITYTIENAITTHSDISEFYWKLIGDKWDKGVGTVHAEVFFPVSVPSDAVRAWGHGPLNGKVTIPDNTKAVFDATNLPKKTFFEVRVLFPRTVGAFTQKGVLSKSTIISEETQNETNTRNGRTVTTGITVVVSLVFLLFTILALKGVIYWGYRWYKYGNDNTPPEVNLAGTLHEPPSDLSPTLVEALLSWSHSVTGASIVATVIELSRRKIIRITKEKESTILGFIVLEAPILLEYVDQKAHVSKLEKKLLEYLFQGEQSVHVSEIKQYGRKKTEIAQKFWKEWKEDVIHELVSEGLLEAGSVVDHKESKRLQTLLY
ncbi:DUF2207 domain-containing protein, partial [Candidatus Woesebacteria bacterium]|nr:DUF2207 domain-containing protein [Candidatus Woesebacteria bacterium]